MTPKCELSERNDVNTRQKQVKPSAELCSWLQCDSPELMQNFAFLWSGIIIIIIIIIIIAENYVFRLTVW